MTPAARASPVTAMALARLISKMVPRTQRFFRITRAMTTAGMVAETVMPAYRPRYALAAAMITVSMIPVMTIFRVSSGRIFSGGM